MATQVMGGPLTWSMTRDSDGERTYRVRYLVKGDKTDGPANALQTSGLPLVGSTWLIDADVDLWAFCRFDATVTPRNEKEPNTLFDIDFTFTTKPDKRCQERQVEDPILEPYQISGGFTRYTEEATEDRFGNPIKNSGHELIRGHQNEWDANRPSIKIVQNVASLDLDILVAFKDTVNQFRLWNLPPRTIKLSDVSWERKFKGLCEIYYVRTLTFEVDFNTWDRDILDEASRVLFGHWDKTTKLWTVDNINNVPPNPNNPQHFISAQDFTGNPTRLILNGHGLPSGAAADSAIAYVSSAAVGALAQGLGYAVGDRVTVVGGKFLEAALFLVDAVDIVGGVTSFSMLANGLYISRPSNDAKTTTNNAGDGLDLTLTYGEVQTVVDDVAVATGGRDYVGGDILTVVGGSFTTAATVTVTAVDANGKVIQVNRTSSGLYNTMPASPVEVSGGSGFGCKLSLDFASYTTKLSTYAVSAGGGGIGYSVDDILTLVGGTFTLAPRLRVTSAAGGVITGVSLEYPGSYTTSIPSNPVAVTGGTGVGATFDISTEQSFKPPASGPTAPGKIHVEKYQESDFLLLGVPTSF